MNINILRSITPRWVIFLIDITICLFSIVFAYYLRFNFKVPAFEIQMFVYVVPIVLFIRAFSFILARTYAGMVRHTSTRDVQRLILVTTIGSAALIIINVINFYFRQKYLIPMSVIIIDFITTAFILSFSRLLVKTLFMEFNNPRKKSTSVAIFGTEQLALITKKTLDRDTESKYRMVAFFDCDSKVLGNKIEGINVFNIHELASQIVKLEISTLIIARKQVPVEIKQEITDICLSNDVQVKTIPDVSSWINGELSLKQIKNIRIEDLLQRPEIKMDKKHLRKQLLDKTILITGAAGSIGSEMVRQLTRFRPKQLVLFDMAESPLYDLETELEEKLLFRNYSIVIGNITDEILVKKTFEQFRPEYVYHAAAYKHVPMMERNPAAAIVNNVAGTRMLADISMQYDVKKFVMVSTDKAVNPTNVMGASKRIAEIYIQAMNQFKKTMFITTRFGNVLGSNGSVIPRFKKQIEAGGPVTVTHPEITRFFMTIPEACQLVLEAGSMGEGGEIFIFDMGEPIKIVNLAKQMIQLSGLKLGEDIQIRFTGLRPGEKLYEELLANKENTVTTYHPRIMIAKVREYNYNHIKELTDNIINQVEEKQEESIVKEMKNIVPEFISQNSPYEKLDI
ncbi:MAG TPA: nucleoside-diphosphate sugar epimerase/dehydratase [Bacteroidales bacterium]|nr:nucleoside-diphosphate sugar epimerase/dehydratase [Bacteroidales bacterium]